MERERIFFCWLAGLPGLNAWNFYLSD